LAEKTIEDKKIRNRPRSIQGDIGRLKILYIFLGHLIADEIRPPVLEEVLVKLIRERKIGSTAANQYRTLISSVYNYGIRMGLVFRNPVPLTRPYREDPGRVRCLTEEEEDRLRAAIRLRCPKREPEFDLALYTGMRRGEQFGLKWSGVDLEHGLLEVNGKTGRRFIKLNATAKTALERLKEQRAEDAIYVCPDTKYDGQRDHLRWFEDAVREAGIKDFRRHDCRHTCASRLLMAGASDHAIKDLLGHRSIAMSARYMHPSDEHMRKEIEKICKKPEGDAQNN
jgi:integrase